MVRELDCDSKGHEFKSHCSPTHTISLKPMLIKKYKTLKSISTILNLNNIIKNSSFFCFVQVKHLNHNEWSALKQIIYPSGLNIFVCKNAFLSSKNVLLNLPKYLWNSLNQGNLIILYSKNGSVLTNKFFVADLFLKKIKMSPLIFYFLNRFFSPKNFFNICETSKYEVFFNLIRVLQHHSYDISNTLTLANKALLYNLNSNRL